MTSTESTPAVDTDDPRFTLTVEDRVATVRLTREDRANAVTISATEELAERLDALADDDDVRALVITGTGRYFSSGLDLHDAARPEVSARIATMLSSGRHRSLHEAILQWPKPTVAAINGTAVGGGLEMALACDLRIAVAGTQLALPEAKRGMGAVFAAVVLPRIVPRALAYEMLYLGEPTTAETALQWGLVNRVVAADEFDAAVADLVGRLVANAPLTQRKIKALNTEAQNLPVSTAVRLGVGPDPYASADRLEGIRAWRERRETRWTAR
ncbi:enoyl-CoA hydratase/isomerase family protein [Millisia brevis]|uniref:enoyl-CoA hydratase/isomerase family protein n=1 Tax=Millisia brevis TaxID=264148 RepID=UPI00082AA8EC|nr:enoyl-CoA hydratase/isomerase family protein [Millisia brevis]